MSYLKNDLGYLSVCSNYTLLNIIILHYQLFFGERDTPTHTPSFSWRLFSHRALLCHNVEFKSVNGEVFSVHSCKSTLANVIYCFVKQIHFYFFVYLDLLLSIPTSVAIKTSPLHVHLVWIVFLTFWSSMFLCDLAGVFLCGHSYGMPLFMAI